MLKGYKQLSTVKANNLVTREFKNKITKTRTVNYEKTMKLIKANIRNRKDLSEMKKISIQKLWKIYQNEQETQAITNEMIKLQNDAYFSVNSPVKEVLSRFHEALKKKGYHSELVGNTFDQLKKIYSTRGYLGYSGGDLAIHQLPKHTQFQKLIEAFEFGHVKGIEYNFQSSINMLKGLIGLRYKSLKLVTRVIDKLEAVITYNDNYDNEIEEYDKNFPLKYEIGANLQGKLINDSITNDKFKGYIEEIFKLKEEVIDEMDGGIEGDHENTEKTKDVKTEKTETEMDIEEFDVALDDLSKHLKDVKEDQVKFCESILRLRKIYFTLTRAQKKKFIGQNTNIMLDMLELEEQLIGFGIISPGERDRRLRHVQIPQGSWRLGPMIRQVVFETFGHTTNFDDFRKIVNALGVPAKEAEEAKAENPQIEEHLKLNIRQLGDNLYHLTEYAIQDKTDINPEDNCFDKYFSKTYQNPENELKAYYATSLNNQRDEAERERTKDRCQYYNDEDFQAPHLSYSKSFHVARDFLQRILPDILRLCGKQNAPQHECICILSAYANQNLSNEFGQILLAIRTSNVITNDSIKIEEIELWANFVEKIGNQPNNMINEQEKEYSVFTTLINKVLELENINNFMTINTYSKILKIGYEMASLNKIYEPLFVGLFKKLNTNAYWCNELSTVNNDTLIPNPKYMIYVYLSILYAETLGQIKISGDLSKFCQILQMSYKLHEPDNQDYNRDPIHEIFLKNLKKKYGQSENLLYKYKTDTKLLPIFKPDIVMTAGGLNALVSIYVKGPLEFNLFSNKNLNLKTFAEGNIIQNYLRAFVDKDTKILYIGYHTFMDDLDFNRSQNLGTDQTKLDELNEAFQKIQMSAKIPDNEFSLVKAADYSQLPADIFRVQFNRFCQVFDEILGQFGQRYNDQKIYNLRSNIFSFQRLREKIESSNKSLSPHELNYRLELQKQTLFNINNAQTELSDSIKAEFIAPVQSRYDFLKDDESKIYKELENLSIAIKDFQDTHNLLKTDKNFASFHGKKLGFELLGSEQPYNLPSLELMNYNLMKYTDYYTYSNWKKLCENYYSKIECNFPENRIMSAFQNSQFAPGIYPKPFSKRSLVRPLSFSMNWEIYAYNYPNVTKDEVVEYDQLAYNNSSANTPVEVDYISALLNLNMNLKIKPSEEALSKIFSLSVYDQLIQDKLISLKGRYSVFDNAKLHEPNVVYLQRDFDSYVEFIQKVYNAPLEEKSYMKFMKSQAVKNLKVRYYHEYLYKKQPMYYRKLKQQGKNQKSYFEQKKFIKKQYYYAIKQYDRDQWDSNGALKASVINDKKFVVVYDDSLFQSKKIYEVEKDADYIIANHDKQEFLKRKLIHAEENLIKMKIIHKISRNQGLSQLEKEFLVIWKQLLHDNGENALISDSYTKRSLTSQNEKDNLLQKDFCDVELKGKNLSLIDLLHELSLWINLDIIQAFERCWILEDKGKEWGINSLVYKDTGINNSSKAVLDLMEEIKWEKANMFQNDEIEHIVDLFGIDRGKNL